MKQVKDFLSEIYLLMSVAYYWVLTGMAVNLVAIFLLAVIIAVIVTKNRALGLTISSLVIALNLFLMLALISSCASLNRLTKRQPYY